MGDTLYRCNPLLAVMLLWGFGTPATRGLLQCGNAGDWMRDRKRTGNRKHFDNSPRTFADCETFRIPTF